MLLIEHIVKRTTLLLFIIAIVVSCQEPEITPAATTTPHASPAATTAVTSEPTLTKTATSVPPLADAAPFKATSVSPTLTPAPIPTSEIINGWLRYENEVYGYQFSYPPEAEIITKSGDSAPTYSCVSLRYQAGYITIAAPPDQLSRHCGVSGVGAYDVAKITETVVIDGRSYTAEGWEGRERDASATWHNEFFSLCLDDGTCINYGYSGEQTGEAAQEEYLATKETLLQSVTSFRSPATAVKLENTLILYAAQQGQNWMLKAYPYYHAFSEDVFDAFYGPVARMEEVTRYTRFNFGPQLSPNGRYLLLPGVGGYGDPENGARPDAPNVGLWFINLQTDEIRQLLPRAKVFTWSPYGDRITYVDGDTLYTLSVAEGAEPQPLFSHPDLWGLYARWSPDGSTIATMTTTQGELDENGYPELTDTYWLVDANSGQAVDFATRPGAAIEHVDDEMTWSPTGRYLLVRNELFTREGEPLPTEFPHRTHWLPVPETLQADEGEKLLANGRDGMCIVTIDGEEVIRISNEHVYPPLGLFPQQPFPSLPRSPRRNRSARL